MNKIKEGYGFAIAAALIWCGFILVSRVGGLSELLASDVIAIRYTVSACLLAPFWYFKFYFSLWDWRLCLCALVGGLAYAVAVFQGFQSAPASHAAILLPGLMPLFIIGLSFFINKESHGRQKWFGIFSITLGIAALFFGQLGQSKIDKEVLIADGWFILAALLWALFSVMIKRWSYSPWQVVVSLTLITWVVYMPIYLVFFPKAIVSACWSDISLQAFYQGVIATIVQMVFYVRAVQLIGPSAMGGVMSIVPVVSGITAIFMFQELVTSELIIGFVLVSFGAFIIHSKDGYLKGKINALYKY